MRTARAVPAARAAFAASTVRADTRGAEQAMPARHVKRGPARRPKQTAKPSARALANAMAQ